MFHLDFTILSSLLVLLPVIHGLPYCGNKFDIDYGSLDNFTDHMCLYCLDTMIPTQDVSPAWLNDSDVKKWIIHIPKLGNVILARDGETVLYRVEYTKLKQDFEHNATETNFILKQFSSEYYRNSFMKCCADARKCCQKMQIASEVKGQCPMTWDGWNCWDSSPPGNSEDYCPDMSLYLLEYLPPTCVRETVTKKCQRTGRWEEVWNPVYQQMTGQTSYSLNCVYSGRAVRSAISTTLIILQSVSLVCTAVGLVLFTFYRLYSQFRLQIHVNFFVSVLLTAVVVLHVESLITRPHLEASNASLLRQPFFCKALMFLEKDIRLMNFFWMLIEGFNFHHMVVLPFTDMAKFRVPIYLVGWGLPHLIMAAYAGVRINYSTDVCWTEPGWWDWVYITPAYICFLINLVLFINLLRVIVIKLMLPKNNHYAHFVKRGVKTSLVLLPIFGLQYGIQWVPVDPTETCSPFLLSILYLQQIVEGTQGIIVTTALCFLNKEVYSCVHKSISSFDSSSLLTSSNTLSSSDDMRRSS